MWKCSNAAFNDSKLLIIIDLNIQEEYEDQGILEKAAIFGKYWYSRYGFVLAAATFLIAVT